MTDADHDSPEVARILELRAARIGARRARAENEDGLPVAEIVLADSRLAVPLADLRAVVPLRHVRSVPLAPPHVIGLVRHEGALLTAFSLAGLVGVRGWRRDPTVLLVVSLDGSRQCAIDSETIPKPDFLDRAAVELARDRANGGRADVLRPDGTVVTLIDLGLLVARARSRSGGAA